MASRGGRRARGARPFAGMDVTKAFVLCCVRQRMALKVPGIHGDPHDHWCVRGGIAILRGSSRRCPRDQRWRAPTPTGGGAQALHGGCSSGVERWTVAPEAAGSKPVTHPSFVGDARPQRASRQPVQRAALFNRGVQPRSALRAGLRSPLATGARSARRGSPFSAQRCSTEAFSLGWHCARGCVPRRHLPAAAGGPCPVAPAPFEGLVKPRWRAGDRDSSSARVTRHDR